MSSQSTPFALGLVVGIVISAAWFFSPPATTPREVDLRTLSATTTTPTPGSGSGAVSIADQPAGDTVVVDSVTVPPPGVWVAVREFHNGVLGNTLGAARARGPVSQLSVPLLRSTRTSTTYALALYRDDGDDAFDAAKDSVYVDFETGATVIETFKTLP